MSGSSVVTTVAGIASRSITLGLSTGSPSLNLEITVTGIMVSCTTRTGPAALVALIILLGVSEGSGKGAFLSATLSRCHATPTTLSVRASRCISGFIGARYVPRTMEVRLVVTVPAAHCRVALKYRVRFESMIVLLYRDVSLVAGWPPP